MRQTKKQDRKFLRAIVESVESRQLFSTVYANLAAGPLTQDWTNTALITTNGDWSAVPSIEGYGGTGLTPTTANDPQTALGFGTSVLNVTANQNSGGISNGGVIELDGAAISNKTIALQPTNTNVSPFLMLRLNTTSVTNVHVKYNLRDVDTSVDIAAAPVALQYRIGETGNFTNLPAGYVANAATSVASDATLVTAVDVTLPVTLEGLAQLQVRVLATNQPNNDQMIGIDDINVTSQGISGGAPTVAFSQANYDTTEEAGTVTVTVNRTGDLTLASDVTYATSNGTATQPGDYTTNTGTLHWNANDAAAKTFDVTIINDTDPENAETINLSLTSVTNATIAGSSTITIAASDPVLPAGLLLNEVKNNPTGNDNPYEYFEIIGSPNQSLNNVYFVSVEGDSGANPGQATAVFSLTGNSLGSNGLLLGESASGHAKVEPATNVATFATFDTATGILQNGTNSFVLIYSTSAIALNQDLDTNDDGTFDLPSGAAFIDGVANTDGGATDKVYAAIPQGQSNTFGGATRILNNTSVNDAAAWYSAQITTTNDSLIYSATGASTLFPTGAVMTPGGANYAAPVSPGQVAFAVSDYIADELAGFAKVTVSRTSGVVGAITVDYATIAGGTATAGSDYTNTTGTVSFADGQSSASFLIPILDDATVESPETINLQLSSPTGGATLGTQTTATISIQDDDSKPTALNGLVLNELEVNPPSTDQPFEYIEIKGQPNASLNGVSVVVIEGDTGAAQGSADLVFDLTGKFLGSNGLLVIKASLGDTRTYPSETTLVTTTNFDVGATQQLENGTNTYLIVYTPASPVVAATDYDTANNGQLILPASTVVLDAVGWRDDVDVTAAVVRSGTLYRNAPELDQVDGTSDAATRFPTSSAPFSLAAWYNGDLLGTSDTLVYDASRASANLPSGAVLTPGDVNFSTSVDNNPPTVSSKTFDFDTSAVAPSLIVTFSEPMSGITLTDLSSSTFTITNRATNTAIPAANFTLTPVSTSVYKITFVGANNAPADGDFKLTINAANAKDLAGNALAANESLNYSFLQADASADRKVNTLDFNLLAGNFGNGGKKFSQGDFSFDGNIDSTDFTILVGQYGKSLPAVPPPAPLLSAVGGGSGSTLFGNARIEDRSIASVVLN